VKGKPPGSSATLKPEVGCNRPGPSHKGLKITRLQTLKNLGRVGRESYHRKIENALPNVSNRGKGLRRPKP